MSISNFIEDFYHGDDALGGYELNETVVFDSRKNITRSIVVNQCQFNAGGLFQNILSNGKLTFDSCEFFGTEVGSNKIDFSVKGRSQLIFQHCTFHAEVMFKVPSSLKIWFIGCTFKNDLSLLYMNDECDFRVTDSSLQNINLNKSRLDSFLLSKNKISKRLAFNEVSIKSIKLYTGEYNLVVFSNCKDFTELNVLNTSFDKELIRIRELVFQGINLKGKIRIQGAIINKYNISPFNNENGRFVHQNLSFTEEVIMMDSDLSDVQFNEVDFSKSVLCLDNSYLSDTVFSNIIWPKGKVVVHYSDTGTYIGLNRSDDWRSKNKREKALIKKEIYRQLKNSAKSESNNIDALDFYKNEMSAYFDYIKGNREIPRWDRFLIRVSKWAGNFGLSYTKPLRHLLVIHTSLFLILVGFGYQNLCFNCRDLTWETFQVGLGEYVYLLNPVHKLRPDMSGLLILIDFVMRLINGFFIYHFIRATRKFAKL